MFSTGRVRFCVIAAMYLSCTIGCAPPALSADRYDARFEIFGFAGLHVLTNLTSTDETPSGYSIAMNLDTRGLASAFVDLWSHSEVQGTLAGETLRPEVYRSEIRRNGTDRHYMLKYQGDGAVIDTSTVPAAEHAYLNGAPVRGTVDQLTAYFLVERQLARHRGCGLVVPVFDGSELYRLRFSDLADETLSPDNYQNFSGPTKVCQVVRDVLVANPNRSESTYQQGKIWFAPLLPGRRMIPVRMGYDTIFGSVSGYLADLSGPAVHLHLGE